MAEQNGRRRVVASTFVTLDGYMVGPDEDISWVIDGFDAEMHGVGMPLFAGGAGRQDFELADLKRYANGVVAMTYTRKEA